MATQTEKDTTYNGWSNYETWNVALWMDNDAGSEEMRQEWTKDAWRRASAEGTFSRLDKAAFAVEAMLKEFIEENNPITTKHSFYSDILGIALSRVDCLEIARNWLSDTDEYTDDEETEETEDSEETEA